MWDEIIDKVEGGKFMDKLIEDEREFKIKRLEGRIEEWNVQNVK